MSETIEIPLLRRGVPIAYTIVDAADDWVTRWVWRLDRYGYATRSKDARTLYLAREILGLRRGDGLEADHINGDRLDNRRANLRVVTHAQNLQNVAGRPTTSSTYRGVSFYRRHGNWSAYCCPNGRKVHLGYFNTELEAAAAASAFRAQHLPFTNEARHLEEIDG